MIQDITESRKIQATIMTLERSQLASLICDDVLVLEDAKQMKFVRLLIVAAASIGILMASFARNVSLLGAIRILLRRLRTRA